VAPALSTARYKYFHAPLTLTPTEPALGSYTGPQFSENVRQNLICAGYVADDVQAITLGSVIACAARSIGSRLVRLYLYNCPNCSTRAYEDTCEQGSGRVKPQRRKLRMGLVRLDAASTPILRALDACDNR
jgi:hypothetical protein